jgi:hypothetical protein
MSEEAIETRSHLVTARKWAMLAAVSLVAPVLLKPLNIFWFNIGLFLHRVVNPIIMFAVFAAVFVPAGAIMARPAQIKTHNRSLDLVDRAQGKRKH